MGTTFLGTIKNHETFMRTYIRASLLLITAWVTIACDTGVQVEDTRAYNEACKIDHPDIVICPASDMAKISRMGRINYEHPDYDWSNGELKLFAARNETVAFQIIFHKSSHTPINQLSLNLGEFSDVDNPSASQARLSQSAFSAFYHPIDNAGYSWGPTTPVLSWPADYPDALVPHEANCANKQSKEKTIIIKPPAALASNQAVWIDTYIPRQTQAGTYHQTLNVIVDGVQLTLPVSLTVYDVTLPDKPSINAVGELYRSYALEGVGYDITTPQWRAMSQCYQRLAHQHRMVFIERLPNLLTTEQFDNYADTIEPAITGNLFSEDSGYIGPGLNTGLNLWRTPWPQTINAQATDDLTEEEITRYQFLSNQWDQLVTDRQWPPLEYFAYVFDEVDGPDNTGSSNETRTRYIARVHEQMARVQSAIDAGSNTAPIDLIWTSHSNPSIWEGQPELDLTDKIRLWAPNASAADTRFLRERIAAGDKAWFYHSGHPAVGAHSINVSGIDMRTWGVIGARYGFQGQLMWAVNLGSDDFPFRDPQYTEEDDRAGNGVMVYPGNQLDKIGYEKSPGPVPSMRLKAWRRGLQDAELYFLAKANSPVAADDLIKKQIPAALGEAQGAASWPQSSAAWIEFHKSLLQLAALEYLP